MKHNGRLKANLPVRLYRERLDRMRHLIDTCAPPALICREADLLAGCFEFSRTGLDIIADLVDGLVLLTLLWIAVGGH